MSMIPDAWNPLARKGRLNKLLPEYGPPVPQGFLPGVPAPAQPGAAEGRIAGGTDAQGVLNGAPAQAATPTPAPPQPQPPAPAGPQPAQMAPQQEARVREANGTQARPAPRSAPTTPGAARAAQERQRTLSFSEQLLTKIASDPYEALGVNTALAQLDEQSQTAFRTSLGQLRMQFARQGQMTPGDSTFLGSAAQGLAAQSAAATTQARAQILAGADDQRLEAVRMLQDQAPSAEGIAQAEGQAAAQQQRDGQFAQEMALREQELTQQGTLEQGRQELTAREIDSRETLGEQELGERARQFDTTTTMWMQETLLSPEVGAEYERALGLPAGALNGRTWQQLNAMVENDPSIIPERRAALQASFAGKVAEEQALAAPATGLAKALSGMLPGGDAHPLVQMLLDPKMTMRKAMASSPAIYDLVKGEYQLHLARAEQQKLTAETGEIGKRSAREDTELTATIANIQERNTIDWFNVMWEHNDRLQQLALGDRELEYRYTQLETEAARWAGELGLKGIELTLQDKQMFLTAAIAVLQEQGATDRQIIGATAGGAGGGRSGGDTADAMVKGAEVQLKVWQEVEKQTLSRLQALEQKLWVVDSHGRPTALDPVEPGNTEAAGRTRIQYPGDPQAWDRFYAAYKNEWAKYRSIRSRVEGLVPAIQSGTAPQPAPAAPAIPRPTYTNPYGSYQGLGISPLPVGGGVSAPPWPGGR